MVRAYVRPQHNPRVPIPCDLPTTAISNHDPTLKHFSESAYSLDPVTHLPDQP